MFETMTIFEAGQEAYLMSEAAVGEPTKANPVLEQDVTNDPTLLRGIRLAKRETQHRFWARFGVTQTRGSRFELGQRLPPSVVILLRLYLNGVIGDEDLWCARRKRRTAVRRQQTSPPNRKANRDRSTRGGMI